MNGYNSGVNIWGGMADSFQGSYDKAQERKRKIDAVKKLQAQKVTGGSGTGNALEEIDAQIAKLQKEIAAMEGNQPSSLNILNTGE